MLEKFEASSYRLIEVGFGSIASGAREPLPVCPYNRTTREVVWTSQTGQ
jgi:hypothetical protein